MKNPKNKHQNIPVISNYLKYSGFILMFVIALILLILIYIISINEKKYNEEENYTTIKASQNTIKSTITDFSDSPTISPSPSLTPVKTQDLISTSATTFPVSYSGPLFFADKTGNLSFELYLNNSKKAEQQVNYLFYINDEELYSGMIPVTGLGNDTFKIKGTIQSLYHPNKQSIINKSKPLIREVGIDGTVNTQNGEANLQITTESTNYLFIQEPANKSDPLTTAAAYMEFSKQNNFTGIYKLLPYASQKDMTLEQFKASVIASLKNDPLKDAVILNYSFPEKGYVKSLVGLYLYIQPVEFTVKNKDGSIQNYSMNISLIKQPGIWRVANTDKPILKN